jgi:hypothetical protein
MKFLRTNEGKTRQDRITHEILKEHNIQNLLTVRRETIAMV